MKDKALKLVGERTALIEALNKRLESVVGASQSALMEMVLSDFVDKLEAKDGKIVNSAKNRRLVALLDQTFQQYGKDHGPAVVKTLVDGVQKVVNFNKKYFATFADKAKLLPLQKQVSDSISSWLGVKDGSAARNGYLDKLIQADQVRQEVKDLAISHVVNQAGLTEARKAVKGMLQTDPVNLGRLEKYYRNFTYDLYSQVDRTAAKIQADKLGLQYAIYEGGLIKTSRKFCKERNGKVFTSEEIAEFDPPEAKQPDYNAATDLGGYGCRHHLNYIPYAVAVALRPDLKNDNPKPPVKVEPDPIKPSPESKKVENPKKIPPETDFAKIPDFEVTPYKPRNAGEKKLVDKYAGTVNDHARAKARTNDISKEMDLLQEEIEKSGRSPYTLDPSDKDPKTAKAAQRWRDLGKELSEAMNSEFDLKENLDNVNELFRNELTKGAGESPVPIEFPESLMGSRTFATNAETAIKFWRKAAAGWLDETSIKIDAKGGQDREFCSGTTLGLNEFTRSRVIVHELAHVLEKGHNEILKAAVDFLHRRTKGAKIEKLVDYNPNYREDEIFKKGGFYDIYVGKFYLTNGRGYKGHQASEVISMGLERMFNDPLTFQREDAEHFNLIYSLFFKDK